jgi:hypothetical protein
VIATTLPQQVADAGGLLGLLLALDVLFTSEQQRRLTEQLDRQGGPVPAAMRTIRLLTTGLAVITLTSVVLLWPTVRDVVAAIGDPGWQPVLSVFVLAWVLLVALVAWQAYLALGSRQREP